MPTALHHHYIRQTRSVSLRNAFAIAVILCGPALAVSEDARAYVVAPGYDYDTPGSITPVYPKTGSLGAAYFVPPGDVIAVAPGTKQIWEAVSNADSMGPPWSIDVLDAKSGATLATIPLTSYATSLIVDAAGQYAYVSTGSGDLLKIDVSSRSIVQTVSFGNYLSGPMALSGDGSKLFLANQGAVVAVALPSLETIASILTSYTIDSMLISGNTLLVTDSSLSWLNELVYVDTTTLQQTNSVVLPTIGLVFGVSPDASGIYLTLDTTIAILDFSSGQTLLSQTFNSGLANCLLSRDGTHIVVASNPVLVVDAKTLATIKTVESVGIPKSAVYLDPDTVLMLYKYTGAMVVIDQSSAAVTASFPLGVFPISEVADPRRGLIYVTAGDESGAPNVVSTRLNRIVGSLPLPGFGPTAVSGSRVYGTLYSGANVVFYNLANGQSGSLPPPLSVPNYYLAFYAVYVPPDEKTLWAPFQLAPVCCGNCCDSQPRSSASTTVAGLAVYSSVTNGLVALKWLPYGIYGIASIVFSPDSSTAYVAGGVVIALYDAHTFKLLGTFDYMTRFSSLAISPDGSVLYAYDGMAVYVLDAGTGAKKQVFELPPVPLSYTAPIALSPDGTTIFVADQGRAAVNLIRTATGQVIQVPVPYAPSGVVVLPYN